MKSKGSALIGLVGLMFIIVFAASAAFAVPSTVNYQGYLTDDSGVPVSGTVSITFRIYDAPTAGTLKWNETQDVDVNNGVYSVQLGSGGSPLGESVFTGEARYLEVEIDGTALLPRLPFTSNAYAVRAGTADSVADGAVSTVMVADGAITSAKLAANSVGSAQIAFKSVNTSDIADNSITSAKIAVPISLSGSTSQAIISGTNSGSGNAIYGESSIGYAGYFVGNVAADDYQYRSSKTYYLNIPPTAFVKHPDSAGDAWSSLGYYAYVSGAASPFSVQVDAPVYLPEGANVTQLRCYYKDSDTTYNVQMIVWMRSSNPSTEALVLVTSLSVTSSGSSTSTSYVNNTTYISSPTIDNASNQYYLRMQWQPETSGNSLQFRGCRIEYTMDSVGP